MPRASRPPSRGYCSSSLTTYCWFAPHVHRMCTARTPHVHRVCTACTPHVHRTCALQEILCQLGVADLLGAASSCSVLRRACAARGCDGAWHRLCAAAWPRLSVALHTASTELAKRGATSTATIATAATISNPTTPTSPAAPAAPATLARRTATLPLPLDWHVLLRERRRLSDRWERGRYSLSLAITLPLILPLTVTLTLTRWERGHYTLSTLNGHKGPVYGVRLRGDLLASSSEDGSIKLWNLSLGTVTHTLGIRSACAHTACAHTAHGTRHTAHGTRHALGTRSARTRHAHGTHSACRSAWTRRACTHCR